MKNVANEPVPFDAEVTVPDSCNVLAVPEFLNLYMQPAVVVMAEKIEDDILTIYWRGIDPIDQEPSTASRF